jgi:hypothetical protein
MLNPTLYLDFTPMRELVSLPLFRGRVRDIGVKLKRLFISLPLKGGG